MPVDTTQINLDIVRQFASEWNASGKKGKPSFCFEMVGLAEGTKIYVSGSKEPVGEVAKRPLLVKTNRVLIYSLKKEYASLEDAERAYKKHLGVSSKSCTGWRYFRAELSDGNLTARLSLRALWDLFPNIESALTGALASASAPKAKTVSVSPKYDAS